jgi:hypothetical protein
MPKRLIDSSYLNSPSLDRCSARAQDAFPRFILLADDFGCFEADTRRLVALGWSSKRRDVSEADVWSWLEEYVAAGMACLWTEKERRWCYLTGWNGAHGQRKRVEYDPATVAGQKGSKRYTPHPPADLVAAVLAGERRAVDGKPPGTDREDAQESANDSTPARETRGSREVPAPPPVDSRQLPAYAVAVPVAVAGSHPARAALVSPFPLGQDPHPLTTAVLAALYDRGLDAAPPGSGSADRVEAAVQSVGIPAAVERLALVYAAPEAKRPLTFHVAAIRGTKPAPRTHGDLGAELRPWPTLLTDDERRRARAELAALHPDLADAPIGITGDPSQHPVEAIREFNDRWRAVAEARS